MLVKSKENKEEFLELINSLDVDQESKEKLISWLVNKSDFFTAPASTKYHLDTEGGLCQHSLNVYKALVKLCDTFNVKVSDTSLKIVGLLHDISKANLYTQYQRNTKDENGNWIQVTEYKIRDENDRFIYGSHEQNSVFMVNSFIPLSVEESTAILHHMGGQNWDSAKDNISEVYNRYPLALMLHLADMEATFLEETTHE